MASVPRSFRALQVDPYLTGPHYSFSREPPPPRERKRRGDHCPSPPFVLRRWIGRAGRRPVLETSSSWRLPRGVAASSLLRAVVARERTRRWRTATWPAMRIPIADVVKSQAVQIRAFVTVVIAGGLLAPLPDPAPDYLSGVEKPTLHRRPAEATDERARPSRLRVPSAVQLDSLPLAELHRFGIVMRPETCQRRGAAPHVYC